MLRIALNKFFRNVPQWYILCLHFDYFSARLIVFQHLYTFPIPSNVRSSYLMLLLFGSTEGSTYNIHLSELDYTLY